MKEIRPVNITILMKRWIWIIIGDNFGLAVESENRYLSKQLSKQVDEYHSREVNSPLLLAMRLTLPIRFAHW